MGSHQQIRIREDHFQLLEDGFEMVMSRNEETVFSRLKFWTRAWKEGSLCQFLCKKQFETYSQDTKTPDADHSAKCCICGLQKYR